MRHANKGDRLVSLDFLKHMRNVPRFLNIEKLADEVLTEHALRRGGAISIPMVPREFTPRPRPKTALISKAAQQAIEAREWAEVGESLQSPSEQPRQSGGHA
jgi:hypothetical protein